MPLLRVFACVLTFALACGGGTCAGSTCPCGQSSLIPAASCLGAFTFCGTQNQVIWIQPGPGVTPYQVYCGVNGLTLAMLINGALTTFRYQQLVWTTGWASNQTLAQDPTLYANYTASAMEALFQSYNSQPGTAIVFSMTGVTSGGAFSGLGTGATITVPVGNFSSLLGLFSQSPVVYATEQPGQPSQWWYCGGSANMNKFVTYTVPLSLSPSTWNSASPGSYGGLPNCNLQGVNVASMAEPTTLALFQGNWNCCPTAVGVGTCGITISSRYRLGIVYNNEADCLSTDTSFGIGGDCIFNIANPGVPYTSSCPSAGRTGPNVAAYTTIWIQATEPPSCQAGYYCPTPFNATPYTAQFICPAGYYCPGNSTTYVDTPCQAGYWGPDGQTNSTCAGLCSLVPGCPTQSATLTQTPSLTTTPSITGTGSGSQTPSPTATPTLSQVSTPSQTQSATQGATPSVTSTSTSSQGQTSSQSQTPSPSVTGSSSPSQIATTSQSGTATRSATQTPSSTSTSSSSVTLTQTVSPSASGTASTTPTPSGAPTPSSSTVNSQTPSPSYTPSTTVTASQTVTPSGSVTSSASSSPSGDPTPSGSGSPSSAESTSQTLSLGSSRSPSKSGTASPTATRSALPSPTSTASLSVSQSQSPSRSGTASGSSTAAVSRTTTQSETRSASTAQTPVFAQSASLTSSSSSLPTQSRSMSQSRAASASVSRSKALASSSSSSSIPSMLPSATSTQGTASGDVSASVSRSPSAVLYQRFNDTAGAGGGSDPGTPVAVIAGATMGSTLICLLVFVLLLVVLIRDRRRSGRKSVSHATPSNAGSDDVSLGVQPADVQAFVGNAGSPRGEKAAQLVAPTRAAPAALSAPAPTPSAAAARRTSTVRVTAVHVSSAAPPAASTPAPPPTASPAGRGFPAALPTGGRGFEAGFFKGDPAPGIPGSADAFPLMSPTRFPMSRNPPLSGAATGPPAGHAPLARRTSLPFSPTGGAPAAPAGAGAARPPLARRSSLTDAGARALLSPGRPFPAASPRSFTTGAPVAKGAGLHTATQRPPPGSAWQGSTGAAQSAATLPPRPYPPFGAPAYGAPAAAGGAALPGNPDSHSQWATPTMAPLLGRRQSLSAQPAIKIGDAPAAAADGGGISGTRSTWIRREPSQAQAAGAWVMGSPVAGQIVRRRRDSL